MYERKLVARVLIVAVLVVAVAGIWGHTLFVPQASGLEVHFLDVGQGDAILIEAPSGEQMLVDGGRDNSVLAELATVMGYFDRRIDYVVATHPDSDHIGGLVDVLERYIIDTIIVTDATSDTTTAEAFYTAAANEAAAIFRPQRGRLFMLGDDVQVEVVWPEVSVRDMERNAGSIVVRVLYGNTSFLLTGDAPKRIEEYLVLTHGEYLESTVLKVGHHGSRTSTSELFLAEVSPQYAIISASADNRYGHPHVEVTDLLFNYDVITFSTATDGTITLNSDGREVWRE